LNLLIKIWKEKNKETISFFFLKISKNKKKIIFSRLKDKKPIDRKLIITKIKPKKKKLTIHKKKN